MAEIDLLFEKLRDLSALCRISGSEQDVVRYLQEKFSPLADEVSLDAFGNLTVMRKGSHPGPTLMISVHSDEVGGIVTSITSDGFIGFVPVGVVDKRILPASRLLVNKKAVGTVSCVPGHISMEQNSQTNWGEKLLIDIGAQSDAQVHEMGIDIGDPVCFISPVIRLTQPNLAMGKAIDNRIGCAILLRLFERLKTKQFPGKLYGVVTMGIPGNERC